MVVSLLKPIMHLCKRLFHQQLQDHTLLWEEGCENVLDWVSSNFERKRPNLASFNLGLISAQHSASQSSEE